jgi:hypothetical protein
MRRLQGRLDHPGQVLADRIQIYAVLQPSRERCYGLVGVIASPVEAPVHRPLHPPPHWAEQGRRGQRGDGLPLAFTLWRARTASGGSAIISASTRPPTTAAIPGEARREPRCTDTGAASTCPAAGCVPPTKRDTTPDRSGNVTAPAQLSRTAPRGQAT